MDISIFLLFLIWLASGVLVVRFVLRTGGTTEIGRVAHWFGGAFVMIGLGIGLAIIFARIDLDFGARANVYVLTHLPKLENSVPLLERHQQDDRVTVYRRGSVNPSARLAGNQLTIDEQQTVRISLWWMLWDTKFTNPGQ